MLTRTRRDYRLTAVKWKELKVTFAPVIASSRKYLCNMCGEIESSRTNDPPAGWKARKWCRKGIDGKPIYKHICKECIEDLS